LILINFYNFSLTIRIIKKEKEKKRIEKESRKVSGIIPTGITTAAAAATAGGGGSPRPPSTQIAVVDRRHLHNYRVVQRNLVYVIGVPAAFASEETLRKGEYLGQYGRIGKIVIHRNHSLSHATVSAYVTFAYKEDAKASIQSLEGHWLDSHLLRASFGTTKYCNNFIRGVPCNNPECVYLHEMGDDEDRFTKEEIQAGHSKLLPTPNSNQTIVTGKGGPSGSGKIPVGEPVFPPPVFLQDISGPKPVVKNASWPVQSPAEGVVSSTNPVPVQSLQLSPIDSPDISSNTSTLLSDPLPNFTPLPTNNTNSTNINRQIPAGNAANSSATHVNKSQINQSPILTPLDNKNNTTSNNINQQNNSEKNPNIQQASNSNNALSLRNNTATSSTSSQSRPVPVQVSGSTSTTNTSQRFSSQLFPTSGKAESHNQQQNSSSFNGLGHCSVFPVPITSLSISIWSGILSSSSSNLDVNPYGSLELPISELIDLTIPPVDATCLMPWPKPLSYYKQGLGADGFTHAPVARHTHKYQFLTEQYPPPENQQNRQQQFANYQQNNTQNGNEDQQRLQRIPQQFPAVVSQTSTPNTNTNILALQSMFPSVKMSVVNPTN
jgi:hypothetical protein